MSFDSFKSAFENPLVVALVAWLAREIYGAVKTRHAAITGSIETLSLKLTDVNLSMARLVVQLEEMQKHIDLIPKLKKDVDAAHDRIRLGKPRIEQ